ncbi:hypothetical protein ACN72_27560 [Escherichia coli]|nr:hypothetical protein [Escherichia coli]MWT76384.1 hypothetical protein [Escherichia coli]OKT93204.1 hypothetical protein ACN72_27560 [Escherichia coli]OKU52403.1 hypothetical protein ACN86_07135 [Escherichia coli]HBA5036146.1 hypothetical protein [Escherichia coli]
MFGNYISISPEKIIMLALRIMQGIAKTLAEHVLDLKHSPLSKQAMKRQTLRLWAEYSLGTINKIIDMKSGPSNQSAEEMEFIRRLILIRRDIHSQLHSVGIDINDGTGD